MLFSRRVYFSLGSNIGDRQKNLERAIDSLDTVFGLPTKRLSSTYETRAEGFEGHDFLNCALSYRTRKSPEKILDICKATERSLGRYSDSPVFDTQGKRIYSDRTIDIDILLYGKLRYKSPTLEIPHPRMKEREFVQKPLKEIL